MWISFVRRFKVCGAPLMSILFCQISSVLTSQNIAVFSVLGDARGTSRYVDINFGSDFLTLAIGERCQFTVNESIVPFRIKRPGLEAVEGVAEFEGSNHHAYQITFNGKRTLLDLVSKTDQPVEADSQSGDHLRSPPSHESRQASFSGSMPNPGASVVVLLDEETHPNLVGLNSIQQSLSRVLMTRYNLISRESLTLVLEEQRLQMSGVTNSDIGVETGFIEGAEFLCLVGLNEYDEFTSIAFVEFIDVETTKKSLVGSVLLNQTEISNPSVLDQIFLKTLLRFIPQ